jgi:hypothetical protein
MPADIEACVKALEGKEGISEPYALCNWMKSEGKGYFAHGEGFDVGAAVAEFKEREKGQRGGILLRDVHAFMAGDWQGERYTVRDLDDICRNFNEFSSGPNPLVEVPFVIGHEEDQPLTGVPAVGWVRRLRRHGEDLYADVEQLFPSIASLVEAGAYTRVSPEIYPRDDPPEGVPARGCMMRRLSALGGQLPHIKQLNPLPQPLRLSEQDLRPRRARPTRLHACRRVWQTDSRTWACFSEVRVMADDATEQIAAAAIKQQFPGLPDGFVESLTPDQLKMLAETMGAGAETPPEGGSEASLTPAAGMVEWPAGLDRQAVEAELVGMGEDQAALAAMTDDDLLALYQQRTGGGATPMSEDPPPEELPVDEPPPEDEPVSIPMPAPAPAPAPAAKDSLRSRQPAKVTVTQQFNEAVRAEARRIVAEETAGLRRDVQRERAARQKEAEASRRKRVVNFCEELRDTNRASPAEIEFGKDGQPIGDVACALWFASPVRKFGEGGQSELEVLMGKLKARPPRRFGEQVPDPIQQKGGAMTPERRRELLGHTATGKGILRREEQQAANHRVFVEQLGAVLGQHVNGQK